MNNSIEAQKKLDKGVIKHLKLQGDNLKEKRNIDYFFYFKTEEDRKNFTEEITKESCFKFSDNHDYFEKETDYLYGVVISQYNSVDLNYIQKLTVKFNSMVEKYYGEYDG